MPTLMLSRSAIEGLMAPTDYLAAIEEGFRAAAERRASSPPPLHIECEGGGFHVKAAQLAAGRHYAAVKLNANFPGNPARGLPTIHGALLLSDADEGSLLAIMDSAVVTLWRTAAATSLAARYLARANSRSLGIIGCGEQAWAHLIMLKHVLPITHCRLFDSDIGKAHRLAVKAQELPDLTSEVAPSPVAAAHNADVVITLTTSRQPVLALADVAPGTFVAGVGADSPQKHELAPDLLACGRVVADVLAQCLVMGDLHHAVAVRAMRSEDCWGELADLVGGKAARTDDKEIWVFDSTGTALEDVAAAATIYERAVAQGCGASFSFTE